MSNSLVTQNIDSDKVEIRLRGSRIFLVLVDLIIFAKRFFTHITGFPQPRAELLIFLSLAINITFPELLYTITIVHKSRGRRL